ncbi:MAG: hypothetical protein ACREAY_09580 [Nitrososphaera sp.]|uniref:hypothetical protein n=1 Tax=Nitrososphaera sp. TaxID=1971748 RepID=UPI003D6E80F3
MLSQSSSVKAMESGAKYGAIAGLIATWSISTAIAASELELGLPIGSFYAIMGLSLGYGDFAIYAGFGLHLLTGTVLGALLGFAAARLAIKSLLDPYRSLLMGMGAGMAVWLVLFLPVTALMVQPSLSRSGQLGEYLQLLPLDAGQFVWGIALSAIVFHLVWGAIFGYMASALMRIQAFKLAHPKGGVAQ